MFTGIIQKIGRLADIETRRGGRTGSMRILCSWDISLELGESVCVQGVCLTVRDHDSSSFICDVMDETFSKTNLASKRTGDSLNLERALRGGDRFGGHFVYGHVDGIGKAASITRAACDRILKIECFKEILDGIINKGSIACDGVSLTVAGVFENGFEVKLIPFTLAHTTLGELKAGQSVNLETDMLGKYVRKYSGVSSSELGIEDLERAGLI